MVPGKPAGNAADSVSWWWGACTLALVLAALVGHRVVAALDADRRALESTLAALAPLRVDADELCSRLIRMAAAAADRRPRLADPTTPGAVPGGERPGGGGAA